MSERYKDVGTVGVVSLGPVGVLRWCWPHCSFSGAITTLPTADHSRAPVIPGYPQTWPSSYLLSPCIFHPKTTTILTHTHTYTHTSLTMYFIFLTVDRVIHCCLQWNKTKKKHLNPQPVEQYQYWAGTTRSASPCQVHTCWTSKVREMKEKVSRKKYFMFLVNTTPVLNSSSLF